MAGGACGHTEATVDTMTADAGTRRIAAEFKRGIETRDAALLSSLCAPDVEYQIVNRNTPPSRPAVVRGKDAITTVFNENAARDMTHRIDALLVDGAQTALRMLCRYPDGTLVASILFFEVQDDHITRVFEIDCWDE